MASGFEPEQQEVRTEFAKELGLKEAIAIAVGAMIGGGIFSALGRLALITGPAAVLSFILGGLIAFLTANSYTRLVAKYPSAGGEFVILRRGFNNPLVGNSTGMMLWLGYSVTIALYAYTFGNYVSETVYDITMLEFFSLHNTNIITGRKTLSFLSIFIFMLINLKGVKETGTVQNVIVLFKVSVLLLVGVLGIAVLFAEPERGLNFQDFARSQDDFVRSLNPFSGLGGVVIGSAVVFVSYEGYQVIANTVEELKNPARDVRVGMYISVAVVTFTYAITTIATFILIQDDNLISETALLVAVERFGGFVVVLVALGAAASTTSAINATLLGSSRLAYVMSDWAAFPKRLAVISKSTQVPYIAIIVTSLISWLFTFFGRAEEIAEVGSIIFLGIFLAINLAILQIFPRERNSIAKIATGLIVIYIILVFIFFFTHLETTWRALLVLGLFSGVTLIWMIITQIITKDEEVDVSYYKLEPLGIELIQSFTEQHGTGVDDFFINLDRMLVPVSGQKFETQNWMVTSLLARRYNVDVTLLHIGSNMKKIQKAVEIFERLDIECNVIIKQNSDIADAIIETYNEGDYQLVSMASRRRESIIDRILDTSVSEKVVDNVDCAVLQVHPPAYDQSQEIRNVFLLFDGSERDTYLARWAKLITSHVPNPRIMVYHMIMLPNTISPEDASRLPQLRESAENFEKYANEMMNQLGFENAEPVLLYGHNFTKAIAEQTKKYEPDAVLIGHTKDVGFFDRLRTHLSYRLMNKVPATLIVNHMAEKHKK